MARKARLYFFFTVALASAVFHLGRSQHVTLVTDGGAR